MMELYSIKNHEGKWFVQLNYWGPENCFTENEMLAILYRKISPTRCAITKFAQKYPNYPLPKLVKLTTMIEEEIIEQERVHKVIGKKRIKLAKQAEKISQERLIRAKKDLSDAQRRINEYDG